MTTHPKPLTRHVTFHARRAIAAGYAADTHWYAHAFDRVSAMAYAHGVPTHVAAAIVAVLSPRVEWEANIRLADRMLASGGTLERGALGGNLAKARALYAGAAPLDVITAPKTRNFYLAIVSQGVDGVVIDRHAIDVATNTRHTEATRPTLTPKQYEAYAACYRRAAIILSAEIGLPLTPSMVQALTWESWRREHKGKRS
jgi:hypothetical protein